MAALRIDGAAAPWASTPTSDEAPAVASGEGFREQAEADSAHCAALALDKRAATAQARAALLGIEARPVDRGAWLLRHANGAAIGIVRGLPALVAAVAGFEAARDDVAALVRRIGGAA